MADEKTPRPKIELEDRGERPAPPAPDDGSYTVGEAVRDGSARLFAWVRRTFPGHEHAFWGGVLGFVTAILFLVLGLFKALVIVVLVFGTGKLKNMGKDLGGAIKGFKEGMKEGDEADKKTAEAPKQVAQQSAADQQPVDVKAKEKTEA